MEGSNERILPVVDVSGSMDQPISGQVTAMDAAISLGLYISERNVGVFKDQFITFSERPNFVKLVGDLSQRYQSMSKSDWGYNTNIQKVFDLVLNSAKKSSVKEDQMPTKILILSDMEFDACSEDSKDLSMYEMVKEKYAQSGYKLPQIVFWNLSGRVGNVPVTIHSSGTALVSGFSPTILKSLLGGDLSPEKVMLKTIVQDRYDY
jgi:hypothetical protein